MPEEEKEEVKEEVEVEESNDVQEVVEPVKEDNQKFESLEKKYVYLEGMYNSLLTKLDDAITQGFSLRESDSINEIDDEVEMEVGTMKQMKDLDLSIKR